MFRKTLVVRALAIAFSASTLALAVVPVARAQTSATGTVFGQVENPAGATILIESPDTGVKRTITPSADGKFSATSMPVGSYKVTLLRNGSAVSTREGIEVSIGSGAEVSFAATQLQTVQVVGRRQAIDVSNVGSTTTFSSAELARLPVQSNVGAIIQLAPQTTRGDTRYGGGGAPSFGGSGASENAYYINGFPVTTLLTQVGFSQLPFNSIAQAQLLTGGYGAEFGRSTGGVVNLVTKRGSNDLVFGLGFSIEPQGLRAKSRNQYFEDNGPTTVNTNGKLQFYNEGNRQETMTESFYFGGPMIKDKLFFFVAAENVDVTRTGIRQANAPTATTPNSNRTAGWQDTSINKPRALLKLDWNITDSNHLEYTKIYDQVDDTRTYRGFNYGTLAVGTTVTGGNVYSNWGPTPVAAEQGSGVDILKYTGYLNDSFTLTALVGQTRSAHKSVPSGYNPALPAVLLTATAPGLVYTQPQTTTASQLIPGANDKNTGARLDLEWRVNSQHTLRAGIDYNKIQSVAGTSDAGGSTFEYVKTKTPGTATDKYSDPLTSVAGNALAQQGYYVQQTIVASKSTPTVIQNAVYIEDKWQVTDRLLLSLGLRNEGFDNRNGDNVSYIKLTKQIAPRLGAAWDVNGDASLKIFGNAGRYHVPLPTNVAIRGAGSSLFTVQNFAYTGVDPNTGLPTGTKAVSPIYSSNNEFGQAKDPKQVAGENLKGMYQDELSLGFEKAVSKSLNVGAKVTYRALRNVIDDFCDDRPLLKWAADNNVDTTNFGGFNCALFNPGRANTLNIDMNGDGTLEHIQLSAAELGYPKVKRKYLALDLFAEYPFDGKWWGKVNYTWSRSTGNAEGQVLSDIGQGDVATTQAWDFPEFSVGADGKLPNDRTHQLKLFGFYQVIPEWGIGANFLAASGRPRNCIGNAPSQPAQETPYKDGDPVTNYSTYGPAYFFCNGVASPRGSQGRLPLDVRLDLNVSYRPAAIPGLGFKVDLFNAFNRQSIEVIEERYNPRTGSTVRPQYASVQSYTAPRYVKLSATYDYKF